MGTFCGRSVITNPLEVHIAQPKSSLVDCAVEQKVCRTLLRQTVARCSYRSNCGKYGNEYRLPAV